MPRRPQRQQQKQRPRRRTVLKRLTWASAGGCRCLHDAAGGLTPVSDGRLVWRCLGCPRGDLAPRGQREPGGPRARPFRMRGRSSVAEAAGRVQVWWLQMINSSLVFFHHKGSLGGRGALMTLSTGRPGGPPGLGSLPGAAASGTKMRGSGSG